MKKITYNLLIEIGADKGCLSMWTFNELFPNGTFITERSLTRAYGKKLPMLWLARRLFTDEAMGALERQLNTTLPKLDIREKLKIKQLEKRLDPMKVVRDSKGRRYEFWHEIPATKRKRAARHQTAEIERAKAKWFLRERAARLKLYIRFFLNHRNYKPKYRDLVAS